jgi:hypothetical protein
MGSRFVLAAPLLAALLFTSLACASDDKSDRATLKGIKAVCLVIEVSVEADRGGVDKDKLQSDIEGRLQRQGAPVDKSATTCLYLNVRALRARGGNGKPLPLYAADFRLEFLQTAALVRDPTLKTFTPTWSSENMTTVPAADLVETAIEIAASLVDQFVVAYKSVNPE